MSGLAYLGVVEVTLRTQLLVRKTATHPSAEVFHNTKNDSYWHWLTNWGPRSEASPK